MGRKQPKPPSDPPIPGIEGEWVERRAFKGKSGFGVFLCFKCNRWQSARAFKNFRQGCKKCEATHLPCFLWWNPGERPPPKGDDDDGPHDVTRCEACQKGKCLSGGRFI